MILPLSFPSMKPAALAALALLLAGCAATQVDVEPVQKVDVPKQWGDGSGANGKDGAVQLVLDTDWWKQFGSAELSSLVNEGRLTTVPGRGTVVTRPRVESNLHLASFTQDMRQRGHRPSTEVLTSVVVAAGEATAKALGVSPGERLWEIERLRLADDEPMAHDVSCYPEAVFPALGDEDLSGSIYAILEATYGVVITDAQQTTWAEQAGHTYAHLLEVAETAPVMVFDRVGSSSEGPVEHTISRYRGDRYQLSMSLQRGPSTR